MSALVHLISALALVRSAQALDLDPAASQNSWDIVDVQQQANGVIAYATYHLGAAESPLSADVPIAHLMINITYDNPQRLRIRITQNETLRWEVPNDFPSYSIVGNMGFYNVTFNENPMGIQVVRNTDGMVVFNLDPNVYFFYGDQDIYFVNNFGYGVNVLGLGERNAPFILPSGTYTIWNRDQPSPFDNGQGIGNMYGSHPFYMIVEQKTNTAFGGFFLNSNAMTAIVNPTNLGFRTTGGIIDLYLFMGPGPDDVLFQYHQLIGTPTLFPYWSYGWHQSRWGYTNISMLQAVYNNYQAFSIPLDALWSDIDYMNSYQDWVFNQTAYPQANLSRLILNMQGVNKHYIPMVDAGIQQNLSYPAYTAGLAQNVFIQSPYNITTPPTPTVGVVWPGNATFPDWTNPNTSQWWLSQLLDFQDLCSFSGIWLDMNENSNFIEGEVGHQPPSIINITTMPWTPGGLDINTDSLDVAAIHSNGVLEYNFHNLNGYYESKVTASYFTVNQNTRPFVLSRSTFAGSGKYVAHWLGDNYSSWISMQESMAGVFNFGMFGIPMVGADICGFNGNTNPELCGRWTQLGALYPFSRNHNAIGQISQEPYALGPVVMQTAIDAIQNKYALYLYIYTQMTMLSIEGGSFFKPVFFEFPFDVNFLYNATTTFMLGHNLIVHPCLWPGVMGTTSFFPDHNWYNLFTGEYVFLDYDNSVYLNMPMPGPVNIHMSQGSIIPLLDSASFALSSMDTRRSNITLVIVQNGGYDAVGTVIFDDGLTNENLAAGAYTQIEYSLVSLNNTYDMFSIQALSYGYTRAPLEWPYISTLIMYGCTSAPASVQKVNAGKATMIPIRVYWNAAQAICKVWLGGYLTPDEDSILNIAYYI
jgi:alpha-glucosidase (family GH31 glycosyl hydrolase)